AQYGFAAARRHALETYGPEAVKTGDKCFTNVRLRLGTRTKRHGEERRTSPKLPKLLRKSSLDSTEFTLQTLVCYRWRSFARWMNKKARLLYVVRCPIRGRQGYPRKITA